MYNKIMTDDTVINANICMCVCVCVRVYGSIEKLQLILI